MDSGKWIRELREERFVKSSDIERISRSIADVKGNADFYVSHSTLADGETGSVPSIHKLFSLAACLKVSLEELLLVFGRCRCLTGEACGNAPSTWFGIPTGTVAAGVSWKARTLPCCRTRYPASR